MPKTPDRPRAPARRFEDKPDLDPSAIWKLPEGHAALKESRTLFPSTVVTVDESFEGRLLISGKNNRKLGDKITKGKFKGYALYCLSLEERATCPKDCSALAYCYGNAMQLARRHRIDDLEYFFTLIDDEIREILETEDGLMIRLHVLGDFPSVQYVEWWYGMLDRHPTLAIFGYTHRRPEARGGDAIGDAIENVKAAEPDRFRIRWSADKNASDSAIVINEIPPGPKFNGALVCPAQRDATACCASCGLCWERASERETIAFVKHGKRDLSAAADAAMEVATNPAISERDFGRLITTEIPKLTRFARSLTRDHNNADDLVQDTLAKALKNRAQFQEGTSIGAWMTTIMRNHFLSERRKDGREVGDPEGFIIGNAVAAESQADSYEAAEQIEEFENLPPDQREAIRLVADGDSYEEAAGKLGVAVGTVKSRVARGRAALVMATGEDAVRSTRADIMPIRSVIALPAFGKNVFADKNVERPNFKLVSPLDLKIESTYQRDLSAKSIKLIRKIISEWDWTKFKPPVCAQTDAGLFVIDGQHTAIAAATHGGIDKIPVLIVAARKMESRAAAFVSHNRDRLVMTPAQIFYGDLAANDKDAMIVMECVVKARASVPRLPVAKDRWKVGQISAVGELFAALKGAGPEVLTRILKIAVDSKVSPISKTVLRGLRCLLHDDEYHSVKNRADSTFAKAIAGFSDLEKDCAKVAGEAGVSRFRAFADLLYEKIAP